MKGIAHFVTGVAIATCFPEVVQRAAEGSLLPVLGGVGGILPDTLDFRFVRYFERYDQEIDPGPEPDANEIAGRVVDAMRQAYESGQPQNVMLHTVRLGPDRWRQYTVRFDPAQGEVGVRTGPVVSTGQMPLPGSELPGDEARVKAGLPMAPASKGKHRVDIFSGPSFKFERRDGELHVRFLDWHRRWSHSLTLAAGLGLGTAGIAALVDWVTRGSVTGTPLWAGLVAGLGLASHVLEDQLGFLGSNLLYPFTRERTPGLGLFHSGDALPNFLTVWIGMAVTLLNLDRCAAQPRWDAGWFLALAVVLPAALLGGLSWWRRRRGQPESVSSPPQQDIVAEVEEVDTG